jgi:hypothetical protein
MDEQASAGLSPGGFVATGLISACGGGKPEKQLYGNDTEWPILGRIIGA